MNLLQRQIKKVKVRCVILSVFMLILFRVTVAYFLSHVIRGLVRNLAPAGHLFGHRTYMYCKSKYSMVPARQNPDFVNPGITLCLVLLRYHGGHWLKLNVLWPLTEFSAAT